MRDQIPVVELLRVSTQEQGKDDRAGINRQIELNKQTIQKHNLNVIKSFKLIDVSGATITHTPEIGEILNLIRNGQIRGIVVADFDRLLRPDDFRSLAILQDIKESNILLYLPEQVIDLNTQSGFLMSGLQSVIAGNELAQIKKRMMGAKEEKRRQGKCPSTRLTLPFGVDYDRKSETFYYTSNAEIVKDIFRLFHDKKIHNFNELARLTGLNNRSISNILRNEIYIGYRHYNEKRSTVQRYKTDGRRADKPKIKRLPGEEIRVRVIDEPLINEEVFWAVQKTLKEKKQDYRHRRINAKKIFLFAGYIKCGVCGHPMYTVPGGKAGENKDYYYCRTKSSHFLKKGYEKCPSSYLRRKPVETRVLDFISEHLSDPNYILEQINSLYDEQTKADNENKKEQLKEKIEELKKKKSKVLDLYVKGIYSEEEIADKAQKIQEEIDSTELSLEQVEDKTERLKPEDYRKDIEEIATAFCEFPFLNSKEQRQFLDLLNPSFYITPEGITKFMLPVCKNENHTGRDS